MGKQSSIMDFITSLDPIQAQMVANKQSISETKYDTVTLAAAVIPAQTTFFATTSADLALKNFEGPGNLVTSGKLFLIQTIGVVLANIGTACTAQNLVDVINLCSLRLQVDQKIMGTFPLHQLTGFGGAFLPSQVAVTAAAAPAGAAANFGVTNGMPINQPFRVRPMLVEGQKQFAAYLIAPTAAPMTLAGTLGIKVCLGGLQFQPIQ